MSRTSFIFALFGLAAACGQADDVASTDSALDAVPGRWTLPASVAKIGSETRVEYDSAPRWSRKNCTGSLKVGTRELGEHLLELFPSIREMGGYACRPNTAAPSRLSVHGTGRALDLHIPLLPGAKANNAKGDLVANWCVEHAAEVGIQMVIWDQTVWCTDKTKPSCRGANGANDKTYGGPNPHTDHLHVELTEEAAARKTSFFVNGPSRSDGGARDAGVQPPEEPEEPTPPEEPEEPEEPTPPPAPPITPDAGPANPPVATAPATPTKKATEDDVDDEPGEKEPLSPRAKETRATARDLDMSDTSDGCSATGRSSSSFAFPAMLVMLVVSRARRRERR